MGMKDNWALKEAKKRVKRKRKFYHHVMMFGVIGMLIILLNVLFAFRLRFLLIPLIIWGFIVLAHYLRVFGLGEKGMFSDNWEQEETQKEYERILREEQKDEQEKEELDLDEPLPEKEKSKAPDWKDQDLV